MLHALTVYRGGELAHHRVSSDSSIVSDLTEEIFDHDEIVVQSINLTRNPSDDGKYMLEILYKRDGLHYTMRAEGPSSGDFDIVESIPTI